MTGVERDAIMSANLLSHLLHAPDNAQDARRSTPTGPETVNYNMGISAPTPPQPTGLSHGHTHNVNNTPGSFTVEPPPPPSAPTSLPPLNNNNSNHNNLNNLNSNVNSNPSHTSSPQISQPPTNSHSLTTSLYQCADCQRRYSRPEHLARHIQTHTLGKRFGCQVCGKAFARADLLKRHSANHENDNDPAKKRRRTESGPGSGRVSHACKACATARVKCEEIKPCTRCRNRNLNCEYSSSEAGSAAALHLLHLSGNTHSTAPDTSPVAQSQSPADPTQIMRDSPSSLATVLPKHEDSQLSTPDNSVEQNGHLETFANPYVATSGLVDVGRMPFSNFLHDVLYEQSLSAAPRLEEAQGLAVLDFCDDTNYDLTDIDFGLLDAWNLDITSNSQAVTQAVTPKTDDSVIDMTHMRQKLVKIWTDSPWRWIPSSNDSGYGEHGNLPVPFRDAASQQFQESQKRADRVIKDKLDQSSRDRILSIVLQTCRSDMMRARVASSFPSVDVMDTLAHIFLAAHSCSVSGWIHWGTLTLNKQWPEWLASVVAGGAVMTPVSTLRKFGFAVQEAVRIAIPSRFEDNNTGIENLGLVQSLVLGQDVGLWSGNRRKMEIAECHLMIPTTMMRYRGKFQRSSYVAMSVDPSDEGDVLERKWQQWCEMESWKRLLFHCYLRDAQTSMTTLSPPTISYAELSLPLPEAKELWFARSASEWKRHFLARCARQSKRPPSLGDLIRDINLLTANYQRLDAQFVISIYLHSFWNLIFEWRQLSAVHRSNTFANSYQAGPNLILNSRHQELVRALQTFQLVTSDWHASLSAQECLLLNLLQMNLHVTLDDLQLFAGKEGEDQARRVYPILQQWTESQDSRQAVWHAGQILRQAKLFPQGHLKDFYAVAVHHAALALWTYGVVVKATRHQATPSENQELVCIDGLDSNQVQRFIGFGQGSPGIRSKDGQWVEDLENPKCCDIVQEILRDNFAGSDILPPIVENLCRLIKELGGAAWAVGLN